MSDVLVDGPDFGLYMGVANPSQPNKGVYPFNAPFSVRAVKDG